MFYLLIQKTMKKTLYLLMTVLFVGHQVCSLAVIATEVVPIIPISESGIGDAASAEEVAPTGEETSTVENPSADVPDWASGDISIPADTPT
jgi:hypothetical protein